MKLRLIIAALFAAVAAAPGAPLPADQPESVADVIETVRSTYKADRQAFLAEALQLTETESAAFWPLYRSYRADLDKLGDSLVKLVLEYADVYPNIREDRASRMLKEYSALEQKLASQRAWYLKRARRILPASKVLRWAQLENRMDLVLRLQIASVIPLAPAAESKP